MTAVILSLVAVVLLVLVVVALGMRSMNRRESALPPERLKEMAEKEETKKSRSTDQFAASEPRMDKFTPDFSPIETPRIRPTVPRISAPRGKRGLDEFGASIDYDEEYWDRVKADEGGFGGSIAPRVGAPRPLEDEDDPEKTMISPTSADAVTMQAPLPKLDRGQGLADLVEQPLAAPTPTPRQDPTPTSPPLPKPATSAAALAEQKTMTFAAPTPEALAQHAPSPRDRSAAGQPPATPAAPPAAPGAPGAPAAGSPGRRAGGRGASRTGSRAPGRSGRAAARQPEAPPGDPLTGGARPGGPGRGAVPPAQSGSTQSGSAQSAFTPAAFTPAADAGQGAPPRGTYPSGAPVHTGPDSTDATWPRTGSYPPNPTWSGSPDIFDDQRATTDNPLSTPVEVPAPQQPPSGAAHSVAASWPAIQRAHAAAREQAYPQSYEVSSGWARIEDDAITGPSPAVSAQTGPARAVSPRTNPPGGPGGASGHGRPGAAEPAGGPSGPGGGAPGREQQPAAHSWPSFGDVYGTPPGDAATPGDNGRRRGSRGNHRAPDPDYPDYYR
ncbi:hypothetical protein [Sinosporangium siamense]|uniref:Uncharacterized protein n=1 Tax=Sinosporangium siamense TaxID=1367973 RepID=A0A919RQT3_9ACTN|nr:hypothetical protein [Sinosporangium siamense]GII97572.1 hypothetical protein Ssi02_78030 [Sinosporangium siamense]